MKQLFVVVLDAMYYGPVLLHVYGARCINMHVLTPLFNLFQYQPLPSQQQQQQQYYPPPSSMQPQYMVRGFPHVPC